MRVEKNKTPAAKCQMLDSGCWILDEDAVYERLLPPSPLGLSKSRVSSIQHPESSIGHANAGSTNQKRIENRGFTLIEVLAALLFLAILVPAIAAALSLSSRVSELSDRRAVAAELAENQLNQELLGSNWESASVTTGTFGADYPGYQWTMTQAGWSGDSVNNMTELAMEVTFPVQGRSQSVKLTTLVNATLASEQGQALSGTSQAATTTGTTK